MDTRKIRGLLLLLLPLAAASAAAEVRYTVPVGDSPAIGPASAKITIVEFLDYQ
jgi:hypothetical protein